MLISSYVISVISKRQAACSRQQTGALGLRPGPGSWNSWGSSWVTVPVASSSSSRGLHTMACAWEKKWEDSQASPDLQLLAWLPASTPTRTHTLAVCDIRLFRLIEWKRTIIYVFIYCKQLLQLICNWFYLHANYGHSKWVIICNYTTLIVNLINDLTKVVAGR